MSQESRPPQELTAEMHEAIRRRAEEIYERSGRARGHDMENWVQAEREIFEEMSQAPTKRRAIIVKLNGEQLVGEYDPKAAGGYHPGEFTRGEPVPVRIVGEKMYVTIPSGGELETTIVRKMP